MLKTKKEKIDIFFAALKSALIDQPKAPKHQSFNENGTLEDEMVLKIIEIIRNQPDISQESIGNQLGISRRIVQKYINILKNSERIVRIGGKRYGHWQIND